MAKGNIAKDKFYQILERGFGSRFLGVVDKKAYVLSEEDGELIPLAISLTCPKALPDFPTLDPNAPAAAYHSPESPEEQMIIQNLLRLVQACGFPV